MPVIRVERDGNMFSICTSMRIAMVNGLVYGLINVSGRLGYGPEDAVTNLNDFPWIASRSPYLTEHVLSFWTTGLSATAVFSSENRRLYEDSERRIMRFWRKCVDLRRRRLAVGMASHWRLGANSPLAVLVQEPALLDMVMSLI